MPITVQFLRLNSFFLLIFDFFSSLSFFFFFSFLSNFSKLVSEMEASVDRLSPGPLASGLSNNVIFLLEIFSMLCNAVLSTQASLHKEVCRAMLVTY